MIRAELVALCQVHYVTATWHFAGSDEHEFAPACRPTGGQIDGGRIGGGKIGG
jgi:hypothetical protein